MRADREARATLPDEMSMVELWHIEGATYNEIGDLIGDGVAGWRLGHGCVIRRNAYPPLLVNPSGNGNSVIVNGRR